MTDPRNPSPRQRILRFAISSALVTPVVFSSGCTKDEPISVNPGPDEQVVDEETPDSEETPDTSTDDSPDMEEPVHVNTGPPVEDDEPPEGPPEDVNVNPGPDPDFEPEDEEAPDDQ